MTLARGAMKRKSTYYLKLILKLNDYILLTIIVLISMSYIFMYLCLNIFQGNLIVKETL